MSETDRYDETVSQSKQESLMKAVAIFEESEKSRKAVDRPDIDTKKTVLFLLFIMISVGLFVAVSVCVYIRFRSVLLLLGCVLVTAVVICLSAKKFLRSAILLYQKLAPASLRQSCVFEPSCSQYMLTAIDKYGVIKGVFRGIGRLLRCHPPNGGRDEP